MVEVDKIIAAVESMGKQLEQVEKENSDLRIKIWERDQEIDKLKTELKQWRNGSH